MVIQRLTSTVSTGMTMAMLSTMEIVFSHVGTGAWRRWWVPMWV
jgi:hypothetical protein